MDKLNNLHIKKLLKELDFIESDFEYRNEIISEADNQFINSINSFLSAHPEIKELYDKKITEKINETITRKTEELQKKEVEEKKDIDNESYTETIDENDTELETQKKDIENPERIKLKKLYREIVKLTHPDIIKKKTLNDLYIEATKSYDNFDIINIYKICSELNIEFEFEEGDKNSIIEKIDTLRGRISFLESTFTWKWHNSQNESEKNQLIVNYLKMKLN